MNSFFSLDPIRRPTFESLEDDEWWNGKDLSKEEIQDYMKSKAAIVFQGSPINEIKKKMFKQKIEEVKEEEIVLQDECTRGCPEEE